MDERPFFSPDVEYEESGIRSDWRSATEILAEGGGRLLDVGCGGKASKSELEKKGYTWFGADRFPADGTVIVCDAHRLPFKNCSFEVVFTSLALQYFEEPSEALAEMHRVLKKGGKIAGSASSCEPFHGTCYSYTHWGIEHLLKQNGFSGIGVFPGASLFLVKNYYLFRIFRIERLAPLCTFFTTGAFFLFQRAVFGMLHLLRGLFIRAARGRAESERYGKLLKEYRKSLPYKFSGHLLFRAEK